MGSNTDDEDLRERIERIEELVLPSRRDVLAGVAGGAATAGLLAGASGRSQAQATAGDVGEAQNPVDLYANNVYPPGGPGSGQSTNLNTPNITNALLAGGSNALIGVAATGQVSLSSGIATVDTGLSATDATFYLALGIDDPDADAKITGRLFWDDSAGTYKIEIVEDGTSVDNPTVNYDVLRVR